MNFFGLLAVGVGLAMDAFAVSICKGLAMPKLKIKHMLIIGGWFGIFQALMPFIGYMLGSGFQDKIMAVDHWVAFILLGLIGGNMIREACKDENEKEDADLGFKTMLVLAVATSIDALVVGMTFAFLKVSIVEALLIIGVTTFVLSVIGVKIGNVFGTKYKKGAEIAGGIILILIGLHILLEHLGIL